MIFSLGEIDFYHQKSQQQKPTVAISACLNGEPVRYDGQSKKLESVSTLLDKSLELVPICPEVSAGMPVPRPPVEIVVVDEIRRIRERDRPHVDVTEQLSRFSEQCLLQYQYELHGYIFKSRSPSCGLGSTPTFDQHRRVTLGNGIQAQTFSQTMPWLLMCEEVDLQEKSACEDFIVRCQLSADVRQSCLDIENGKTNALALEDLHKHYLDLIEELPESRQLELKSVVTQQCALQYWQLFAESLQSGLSRKSGAP